MTTIQFTVPAITCGHCVSTVQRAVDDVEGARFVSGDPEAKTVRVQYDPPATLDQIVAAMTEWDYPPSPEHTQPA